MADATLVAPLADGTIADRSAWCEPSPYPGPPVCSGLGAPCKRQISAIRGLTGAVIGGALLAISFSGSRLESVIARFATEPVLGERRERCEGYC